MAYSKYAQVSNGSVLSVHLSNRGVTVGSTQHPASIFRLWSEADLKAIGLLPYVTRHNGDPAYQDVGETVVSVEPDIVYENINYVDRDLTTLKNEKLSQIRLQIYEDLRDTDWYVVRQIETGVSIPDNVKAYRNSLRQLSNSKETAITNANSATVIKQSVVSVMNGKPPKPSR